MLAATRSIASCKRKSTEYVRLDSIALWTGLAFAAGLLWRVVRFALAFPLWGDEAYVAVNLITRDLAGLAQPLEYFQIAPPAFLLTEWLAVWALGAGELSLRLFPFLAGVVSLGLFWRFCRTTTTRRTTLLAVAILAASFYPVRHSTEVKPYAIDMLVALLLLAAAWKTERTPQSWRPWLVLSAVAAVGVWFSYAAALSAFGASIFLARHVVRRHSLAVMARFSLYALSLALSWSVMFVTFARPQSLAADFLPDLETWKNAFPPLGEPWKLPTWLIDVHTGNMLAYPYGANNFGSALSTCLVISGIIRMASRPARRPLLALLLSPLPPALAAAALGAYPYGTSARVMLYMAPAFCLLIAEGIMLIFARARQTARGPIAVAAVLTVVALVCMAANIAAPYKAYDDLLHRAVAQRLNERSRPGDQWIVFNGATPPPRVPNLMVLPLLQRVGEAHYYLLKYAPVPVRWEPNPESIVPGQANRFWLIVQNHGDTNYFPVDRLAEFRRTLEARLGPAEETMHFDLPRGETWSIALYHPARAQYRLPVAVHAN